MIRDMDLMRKILFKIEEIYKPGQGYISSLKIDGYDNMTVAEHCDFLCQKGLIKHYKPSYADDRLLMFSIGNITNAGYDYLELIRNDDVWEKTTTEIEKQKAPKTIEIFTRVAAIFSSEFFKNLNS